MTNSWIVCLVFVAAFCSNLSYARQLPKECSKGPSYWCESLKNAADCGAVGHCTVSVWEVNEVAVAKDDVSEKFIKLFKELKDVKDLINEEYLSIRVNNACHDLTSLKGTQICKDNTVHLEKYLNHVLSSKASAETMCKIVGMCNNEKLNHAASLNKKTVSHDTAKKHVLIGGNRCTWGPSYWCANITTGHECGATSHCVEKVWSKMKVAEDTDSICKICTDMVTQARDQLESNETQEELKQVFEGSCKLIPIKIVAKECMKMADEFVPDLVETLASQMNPQVVCSVAGLCNNARIDSMLVRYNSELKARTECNNCRQTVTVMRKRFDASTYEGFLMGLLQVCRNMDSLTDSCSMLVFKYYENILAAVDHDLLPQPICHLSGQCVHTFHSHGEFTFEEPNLAATDDVPCEFCEQLVVHLRDVLVANTTEMQFYKVLQGICNQTGNFKTECHSLVEQYYPVIYQYLISGLQPKEICELLGVCSGSTGNVLIAPLISHELTVKALPKDKLIGAEEAKIARVPISDKKTNVRIVGQESEPVAAQLPVERMFITLPESKTACAFCQYFLHYLQVELSDVRTEDQIKAAVEKACDHLPEAVSSECKQFVTEYGPAVIALMVQEIDPASVCPALGICAQKGGVRRVSINEGKSNCPLCLFAVEQLETMLKDNRTTESIRHALDNLCTHLSSKLRTECTDFVDTYSTQLMEMLVADLDAQEICVYLKLCTDESVATDPLGLKSSSDKYHAKPQLRGDRNNHKKPMLPKYMYTTGEGDVETNEIPDNTAGGRPIVNADGKVCIICEFVMKEIDDQIKDKHNEDEIKKIVHGVCKSMPKSVRPECDAFVEKYADLIISLLAQELEPEQVCAQLKLCPKQAVHKIKEAVLDCAVCETVVMAVKKVLANDKMDRNIVHIVEKSCALMPAKYVDRCHTMLEIYGESVIHLIEEIGTKGVCQKIGMCAPSSGAILRMYKDKQ